MSPGEVKGFLRQLQRRKSTSPEERTAVEFAIDTLDLLIALEPIISKARKGLENVRSDTDSSSDPAG